MAITLQGDWTLRVRASNGDHRLVIHGADSGGGVHEALPGRCLSVCGAQWTLALQKRRPDAGWRECRLQCVGFPGVAGELLRVTLHAGESLQLEAWLPLHPAEHVVYGTVGTYAGGALFNPGRDDYLVLDPSVQARAFEGPLGPVLRKLYPEGAPSDLAPLVVPTGLPHTANGLVFEQDGLSSAVTARRSAFRTSALAAGRARLDQHDLDTVAALREAGLRLRGPVQRAPGLLLRVQAYQADTPERSGGPYRAQGDRHDLGLALTDDLGHYLCRFRLPAGSPARPDLVVQVLGSGLVPCHESAPYNRVANLQRIDLCLPLECVQPEQGAAVTQPAGHFARAFALCA